MSSTKRKMPVKTDTIKLTGEWEGWEFVARINPSLRCFADAASGDFDRMESAVGELIISWNFVDESGDPLEYNGKESASILPLDLVTVVISAVMERLSKVPPS